MRNKKSWLGWGSASAITAMIAGFTFGSGLIPVGAAQESLVTPPATFEDQIGAYVLGSIEQNARAQSFGEWEQSGFTPLDIFQNVAAFKSTDAWKVLCQKLTPLPDGDLVLFEDPLTEHREIDCLAPLIHRIEAHWEATRASLRLSVDPSPVTLRSEVRHIDVHHGESVIRGGLKPGEIAITLNDGPHFSRTPRILKALADAQVRATFFSVGRMAQKHPELAQQAVREGHTFGSHSWGHVDLAKLDIKSANEEILHGAKAVANAAGVAIPFFRFPYDSDSSVTAELLHSGGMTSFLWNIDSRDWAIRDPRLLLENFLRQLDQTQGGIALFHDTQEQTAIALPLILRELAKRQFKTVVFVPR